MGSSGGQRKSALYFEIRFEGTPLIRRGGSNDAYSRFSQSFSLRNTVII